MQLKRRLSAESEAADANPSPIEVDLGPLLRLESQVRTRRSRQDLRRRPSLESERLVVGRRVHEFDIVGDDEPLERLLDLRELIAATLEHEDLSESPNVKVGDDRAAIREQRRIASRPGFALGKCLHIPRDHPVEPTHAVLAPHLEETSALHHEESGR